jgi:hypothetical protein
MLMTCDHDRCADLRARIQQITDGEYATAKRDVDALRAELGQPPLPGLQATLEEKSQQYVCHKLLRTPTHSGHRLVSWLTISFSTVFAGISGICKTVVLAPIRTTSARQTRLSVRALRERVESGPAGGLRGAKIGWGRHQVVAMGPSLFRWRRHEQMT